MADSEASRHARQHARNEMAERIAAHSPFSIAQVMLILDGLSEAEARQVCALARRWGISPSAASAVLNSQTDDIHAVLDRLRTRDGRRWPVCG